MDKLDEALNIVKENESENQSIINFIEDNPIFSVEITGHSVLVRGLSDQAWIYISSNSRPEFKKLVKKINKEDKFFAAIKEWMLPYISVGRKLVWDLKTAMYVLPDHVELPKTTNEVHPLSAKDADYIHKHSIFNEFVDVNYFRDRILKGYSAGIMKDNRPIAWILTQDDGALNFLYVMKEYRRQGLANSVILALTKKIRKCGRQPYMYIEDSRNETIRLATNLGFEKKETVHWFSLA
ncbi:MAG: GNAT family N-acetyltransferase [Victivallales bacterium]|nr:GNAT family N-acetyltransferase [Victivallales bacterium]